MPVPERRVGRHPRECLKSLPEKFLNFLFHPSVLLNQSIAFLGKNRADFGTCQDVIEASAKAWVISSVTPSRRRVVRYLTTGTLLDLDVITGVLDAA